MIGLSELLYFLVIGTAAYTLGGYAPVIAWNLGSVTRLLKEFFFSIKNSN